MSLLTEWFERHSWLRSFEEGQPLSGTPEDKWRFYFAVQAALESLPLFVSKEARISKASERVGTVVIEPDAQILPGAFVEGPAYIGQGVVVGNGALIRAGSFLSRGSVIGNHCYCTASVLAAKAGAFHFCGVSRSVLERNCRLSAFVVTGTARPDLQPIPKHLPKDMFSMAHKAPAKRGCLIGENTFLSSHVCIAPGIAIGPNCLIAPFTYVHTDVPPGSRVEAPLSFRISKNRITVAEIDTPAIQFEGEDNETETL